ncbi:hypothetical protein ACF0H5_023945 [Mactra antiquata]
MKFFFILGFTIALIVQRTYGLKCNKCRDCKDADIKEIGCSYVCFEGQVTVNDLTHYERGCVDVPETKCGVFNSSELRGTLNGCTCTEDFCNDGTLGNDKVNGATRHITSTICTSGIMLTVLIIKTFFHIY